MPNCEPKPVPPHAHQDDHAHKDDIASRAWAEALAMACGDADHAHRPPGELLAASLRAHRTLSRGLGQSVPLTALGPNGGVLGLAAFVAVYAAQSNPAAPELEVPYDERDLERRAA
ncbi:hypothetical protein GCM10010277_74970 [Streptomyces longisporoflavus]|uniref:hypothetical protein n=1 Tax=Streptomyces longisporoflavus TaxID=28044 RepID=UPI00167DDC81|nr:hypothetical protein [Streptomyces longisporoflavus]GGV66844.1 hypothetical protein GCM10010277_74970 [Streptomyces longisporoflavus]